MLKAFAPFSRFVAFTPIAMISLFVIATPSEGKSVAKTKTACESPLYVSGVQANIETSSTVSLSNFFAYFANHEQPSNQEQQKNQKLNIARKQAMAEGHFTKQQIAQGLSHYYQTRLRQDPLTRQPQNLAELYQYYQVLNAYNGNFDGVLEAVRLYQIDPQMDLTLQLGKPLSLINFILDHHRGDKHIAQLEELIYAGVPITPEAIFAAIFYESSHMLALLLQHFGDDNPDYRVLSRRNNETETYSYVEYAAAFGHVEHLALLLDAGIGRTDTVLELLLTSYTRFTPITLATDYDIIIDNYNQKLALLLNLGFSASSKTLLQAVNDLKPHLNELAPRLLALAKTPRAKAANEIEEQIALEASDYLTQLKAAKSRWPFFMFSYDKACKKVPADSHYRLDNLMTQTEFNQWVKQYHDTSGNKKSKQLKPSLIAKGDIYLDWYGFTQLFDVPTPIERISNRDILNQIYRHIEKGNWYEVSQLMMSQDLSGEDLIAIRNEVLNIALEFKAPAHLTDSWLQEGGIVYEKMWNRLVSEPKNVDTVVGKLERQMLQLTQLKSILYRASEESNLTLVKALLASETLAKKHKTDQGLSALTWTLLNYTPPLKAQLTLLLKQHKTLTPVQQQLLKRIKLQTQEKA